jgi:uncharacterized protein (DUF1697 family)
MPKSAAFLRAINTGGHRVKMDHLRKLFEDLGFTDVFTYIASGNVIFDSVSKRPVEMEAKIEDHLRDALGYDVPTFIRSINELTRIADYRIFGKAGENTGGETIYIAFLRKKPGKESRKRILSFSSATDRFKFHNRELYWLCRNSRYAGDLAQYEYHNKDDQEILSLENCL